MHPPLGEGGGKQTKKPGSVLMKDDAGLQRMKSFERLRRAFDGLDFVVL